MREQSVSKSPSAASPAALRHGGLDRLQHVAVVLVELRRLLLAHRRGLLKGLLVRRHLAQRGFG